ncbi:MAG: GNAT family N-acetyltransferase [Vicingaceae bacterium]|nr:GNAT family N-acetyltransferase [Vicingaceae bacterium]
MKDVTIDLISISDVYTVSLIHKLCFIETYKNILDIDFLVDHKITQIEKYWRNKILSQDNESYKFILENKFIGFISVGKSRNKDFGEFEIFSFYILQEFQNYGIGSYVFNKLMANKTNFYVEVISNNTNACKFYEKQKGKKLTFCYETFGKQKVKNIIYKWSLPNP